MGGSGLQHRLLHAADPLPFSHAAGRHSRRLPSPQPSPSAVTADQDASACPCRPTRAARQEVQQGPVLLLGGQSFTHFYLFQPRHRPWRWQLTAHSVLPEAVLTLQRKRELTLISARRAREGRRALPRGWQEALETNSSGRAEGGDTAQQTAGTAGARTALGW